ncbi:MAG: Abi family protein [Candidatus Kapabacteria bacterium]|nr:Abi family protein [Candidatus Kapabacteria bacterium]
MSVASDKRYMGRIELVELLKSRGMIIDDDEAAHHALTHIGFHRLRAYWIPLVDDPSTKRFRPRTTFGDVLRLYEFDRRLRILFVEAIEAIEISFRATMSREYARSHQPNGYVSEAGASNRERWTSAMNQLKAELGKVTAAAHGGRADNQVSELPPIWTTFEMLSFGSLSYWFSHVLPPEVRQRVARCYHVHQEVLTSWLHHLSVVRNIVAHHGRLWNRRALFLPKIPKRHDLQKSLAPGSVGLYNTCVILQYLLDQIQPDNSWRDRLYNLICSYEVDHTLLGFPDDWRNRDIWRCAFAFDPLSRSKREGV